MNNTLEEPKKREERDFMEIVPVPRSYSKPQFTTTSYLSKIYDSNSIIIVCPRAHSRSWAAELAKYQNHSENEEKVD